jgi:hypothetical protein
VASGILCRGERNEQAVNHEACHSEISRKRNNQRQSNQSLVLFEMLRYEIPRLSIKYYAIVSKQSSQKKSKMCRAKWLVPCEITCASGEMALTGAPGNLVVARMTAANEAENEAGVEVNRREARR